MAVAALAAALLAAACDEGVSGGSGAALEDGASSKSLVTSLCRAAEAAAGGDVAGAGERFADVHASLHELAAQLGSHDDRREDVARVLEAKQRVEADLDAAGGGGLAGGPQLAGDLRTLAGAVGDATGGPVPAACG